MRFFIKITLFISIIFLFFVLIGGLLNLTVIIYNNWKMPVKMEHENELNEFLLNIKNKNILNIKYKTYVNDSEVNLALLSDRIRIKKLNNKNSIISIGDVFISFSFILFLPFILLFYVFSIINIFYP